MFNLIKFEFYKLRNSKTFRNALAITIALIIFNIFIYFKATNKIFIMCAALNGNDVGFVLNNFSDKLHPTAIEFCRSAAGFIIIIEILVLFLIGSSVVDEYSNGTIKNIVAYGHKRIQIYLSKLLTVSIAILLINTLLLFGTAILGMLVSGHVEGLTTYNITELLKLILLIWIVLVSMASIYMCFAILVKSKSVVVGIGTLFIFLSGLCVVPLYQMLNKYPEYTPTLILMDICNSPRSTSVICNILMSCAVMIVITTLFGLYVFKKQDIK